MDKSLELRRKMFKRDVLADFPDKPRSVSKPPEKSKDKTSTVDTPRAGVKETDKVPTYADVTDTQETPKAGDKDTDKISTNTDATVTQGSRTRNRAEKPVSETSFTDHLHSLNEGFAKEIMTKDRQLRDGRDDYEALRTEYWNYKLSFLCEKAKVNDLTRQLDDRDLELNRLKVRLDVLEKENTTLKDTRSSSRSGRSSVEEEEDLLPTAPCKVKGQGRPYTGKSRDGGQLPSITENNRVVLSPSPSYNGKSRDHGVQLPSITENNRIGLSPSPSYTVRSRDHGVHLPLITENNRVVTSSSSSYTGRSRDGGLLPPITENNKVAISSSASSTQGRTSSIENAITSSAGSRRFAPAPPKHPRPSKPSTRSRIPRAIPPFRRTS